MLPIKKARAKNRSDNVAMQCMRKRLNVVATIIVPGKTSAHPLKTGMISTVLAVPATAELNDVQFRRSLLLSRCISLPKNGVEAQV